MRTPHTQFHFAALLKSFTNVQNLLNVSLGDVSGMEALLGSTSRRLQLLQGTANSTVTYAHSVADTANRTLTEVASINLSISKVAEILSANATAAHVFLDSAQKVPCMHNARPSSY